MEAPDLLGRSSRGRGLTVSVVPRWRATPPGEKNRAGRERRWRRERRGEEARRGGGAPPGTRSAGVEEERRGGGAPPGWRDQCGGGSAAVKVRRGGGRPPRWRCAGGGEPPRVGERGRETKLELKTRVEWPGKRKGGLYRKGLSVPGEITPGTDTTISTG
jgi:hypothetical protein